MILSWSGECSTWECDELGHMNMRFYLYKVAQARQFLALKLGLGTDVLRPCAAHIKYLAEARPGNPLYMKSGVIGTDKGHLENVHLLHHADERVAATIVETVAAPNAANVDVTGFQAELPKIAVSRGFDLSSPLTPIDKADAQQNGFRHIGSGIFRGDEIDRDERVRAECLMGRVTETVGHFRDAWPENYVPENYGNISGVLLEARLHFFDYPKRGDGYEFYSGVLGAQGKVRTLRHLMVDAITGQNFMTMIGIAGVMDLQARKLLDPNDQVISALQDIAITAKRVRLHDR